MIVAGTGHRPDKLGGYNPHTRARLLALATWWLQYNRPDGVVSGMAQGWDTALAEAAVALGIPFIAAVPFEGQQSRWPYEAQKTHSDLLLRAHEVVIVCPGGFSTAAMQRRNIWMVDNSDGVLALWDGSTGGTKNCVRYAEQIGREVLNLWPYYPGQI